MKKEPCQIWSHAYNVPPCGRDRVQLTVSSELGAKGVSRFDFAINNTEISVTVHEPLRRLLGLPLQQITRGSTKRSKAMNTCEGFDCLLPSS